MVVRIVLPIRTANNLGVLYRNQGKLDEAKEMYMRALKGREKALGVDHISTLRTANNFGNLYADQGKLDEADIPIKRFRQNHCEIMYWSPKYIT